MADKKISALTGATTPLAGSEVLPIVQSSTTVKVAVSDLTAGRSFDALGMTLTSTDAGATAAPTVDLYRNSASPAAADTLGEVEFNGKDSAGNKQAYGLIHASILSPTSTAEQGQIHFETATAGALTEKMIIGTTNLVVNEIGAVFNVRIEGDADANLFFTDATNDRIGVGTISPAQKLDVVGNIQSSGNAIFSTSGKGILGTTTNNNADAGVVGEFVSSTVVTGSAVTINYGGSGVPVTSISLTAGDWDVTGWVGYNIGAASVVTYLIQGVSTSNTSITGETTNVYNQIASTTPQIPVVIQRFSIASTTTVYLSSATGGSGTALTAYGTIRARRIR